MDSPTFQRLKETFMPMLAKEVAEYAEPDQDDT